MATFKDEFIFDDDVADVDEFAELFTAESGEAKVLSIIGDVMFMDTHFGLPEFD
jgi:hypothetical protein